MSLVLPATVCLVILSSFGAVTIAQWTQWIQITDVKSHYHYAYWKVPTAELLLLWTVFLKCWSNSICGVSAPY